MAGPTAEVASLAGRTLGHYRILDKIGEGGMGEVYRAHDEHLDCDVAIKVLPPGSVGDESARKRFQKEARALARLNHPNIAIVHHFDTQQGVDYLVMEFISGITLSQKLAQGRLAEKEVIRLALQLAEGLSAAHEHGVIHSDVKPSNLRLSSDGRLKILDFGVAKLRLPVTESATTQSLSDKQIVGGTLPYMAPEQLLAGEVDARTDIHAAGCVLYEMATGRRPFADVESSQLIGAILSRKPLSPAAVNPALSAELERIIGKCLEKEPENRYQSTRELGIDLRRLQAATTSGLHETGLPENWGGRRRASRRSLLAFSGVALVIVLFLAYWVARPRPQPRVLSATQLTNDGRNKYAGVDRPLLTDGSRVYFEEANPKAAITQVSVTGGDTTVITSLEQFPNPTSEFPAPYHLLDLSPVRSEILFGGDNIGHEPPIEALSLPAGQRRLVGDLRGHDAGWSPDGQRIAFVNGKDLYVAKSDGSESRRIVAVGSGAFGLRWSPDGTRIRFTLEDKGLASVAKMSQQTLWEVKPDGSGLHPLLPGWSDPPNECCGNWTPNGKFFVFQATRNRRSSIWALPEERRLFQSAGYSPVLLISAVGMNYLAPVVSLDGKKIFVKGAAHRGEVVRYDKQSGQFVPYLGGISAEGLDFSRDGHWVTYVTFPEGSLWRSKVDGRERMQLTFPPMVAFLPRWSPDGRTIAFAGLQPGAFWHIYIVSVEGGQPRQMTNGQRDEFDVGWSPDGTSLIFGHAGVGVGPRNINILNVNNLQLAPFPGSAGLWSPRWSPNGRYLAAYPSQPGKLMLYDFATKKWTQRSIANPDYVNWSADSKYLYADTLPSTGPAIVRIRMSDGKMENVANLKNIRRAYGMFSFWSGLMPDNSPLLLRDTGTQEIYALDWEAQ